MIGKASLIHDSFRVGITLKGIDGLLEVAAAIALWVVSPAQMNEWVKALCEHMLLRAPHSRLAIHLLDASQKLSTGGTEFAAYYLFSHGLVKAILVICLWMNKLWAYPLTIAVFAGFMVYQMHRYLYTHSLSMAALTVFDALIIYLTWMEFRQQRLKRMKAAEARS